MPPNSSIPSPSGYSPLSIQGHSLQTVLLTVNDGQWSNLSELLRQPTQAKLLSNFQMLKRGIWSNPRGIGWSKQRSTVFNSGAAFMDFGVFVDFAGNQTLLFQVGNTLYSYNLNTNTETAYTGALANLSTSLVNLPTMRDFVDSTSQQAPYTVYTNGAIQPQKIVATADKQGVSTEYTITTASSAPEGICVGPDGNIWAVEGSGNKILQVIPLTGAMKEFVIPTASSAPRGICAGSDGNLWFTEQSGNKIGKMTTLGAFTEYVLPTASSQPYGICLGPDNLIWFTEFGNNKVASITTNGLITEYTIPTGSSAPTGICAGPDKLVWFTESSGNKIGKITTSLSSNPVPGTITEYTIPTSTSGPQSICVGPISDGRLWFTEDAATKIGAITTAGTITEFFTGITVNSQPYGICLGNDGNLWFTENAVAGNNIGRITPAGVVTEYAIPTSAARPQGIVYGGNNQLWYTENATNKIGALQLANLPMQFIATVNTTPNTPTVTITEYLTPTPAAYPAGITSFSDGNIWFIEANPNATVIAGAAKITTAGVITEYPIANANDIWRSITAGPAPNTAQAMYATVGTGASAPIQIDSFTPSTVTGGTYTSFWTGDTTTINRICAGPDGNVWCTTQGNTVTKITPGGVATQYTLPTGSATPWGICAGPDGNLWFTEKATTKIGKVTPTGTFTEYTTGLTASCQPYEIISGPDGNLWFTEFNGNNIGRITTSGQITEFAIPTANSQPTGLCVGQDGNIYFCESNAAQIGMITTAGVITEYPTPTAKSQPQEICLGPDNNIWFTEYASSKIGKLVRTVNTQLSLTTQTGLWPGIFFLNGKTYSKPKYSTYFNNRMVYFGFDPTTLAAYDVLISNQGNGESFVNSTPIQATDACSFTVPGLGLPTGCTAFRLANTNNQEILLLGFQNGVAVIAGNATSSDATTYELTILTRDYGLMSNRTFNQIQNDMFFWSTNGLRNYSNLSINANLLNSNLTYQMQDVIQNIVATNIAGTNVGYDSQSFSVHHRDTLEVQYWYPDISDGTGGANYTNQHAIIMNYNSLVPVPQQISPIFSVKSGTAVSCGIEFNGTMYGGGYDGSLQVHYSGNTYNGAAIPGAITLSLINAGNLQQNLELRQGIVVTEGDVQDFNVIVYFYTKQEDGTLLRAPSPEEVQELSAGVEGETILGSWVMGQSTFPATHIKHLTFTATGEGPYAEIQFMTNGTTQALDFDALAGTLTVGGLRP